MLQDLEAGKPLEYEAFNGIVVHLLRLLLSPESDDALVSVLAFVPARYTGAGSIGWPALVDPVTYQFLHANLIHLGVNMLALLAFGSGVERRIGWWKSHRNAAMTPSCRTLIA